MLYNLTLNHRPKELCKYVSWCHCSSQWETAIFSSASRNEVINLCFLQTALFLLSWNEEICVCLWGHKHPKTKKARIRECSLFIRAKSWVVQMRFFVGNSGQLIVCWTRLKMMKYFWADWGCSELKPVWLWKVRDPNHSKYYRLSRPHTGSWCVHLF